MRKIGLIVLLYFVAMSSVSAATRPWAHERDHGLGFDFKLPARFVSEDRRRRQAFVSLFCLKGR